MVLAIRKGAALAAIGLTLGLSSTWAATERPLPRTAGGQPVRNADGSHRNYWREQLKPPAAAATSAAAGATAASPPALALARARRADWGFAAFGSGIGLSGIAVASVNGVTEVYTGGSTSTFGADNYWYALRYDKAKGALSQVQASEYFPQGIVRIGVAGMGGKRMPQIVVAAADGTLARYDQRTKELVSSAAGPCSSRSGLQAFTLTDLDGDGADEWLSVCGDQTLVVNGPDSAGWSLPGVGGTEIVVGQMDDDAALEIATTSGRVIDAGTHAVQWVRPEGFGAHLQVADIDGDGRGELIAADSWYYVWSYDVDKQLPKWSLRTSLDIGAILMADLDGDGRKELLVGDGQWGSVHAYDAATLQEKGSIANPEHGVTQIVAVDLTGDGKPEILFGAGATSTGSDHLYIADWAQRKITWQNEDLSGGPFIGPAVGDLDGDGVPEIVVVSFQSESGYDSGRIVVIDSRSLAVRAISPGVAGGGNGWTGVHDLKLRDIDGDGRPEIVVATDWLYDGVIEAYKFSAQNQFALAWTNKTRPSSEFTAVEVADVDGDGKPEVVGAAGGLLYAYDQASGAEKWRTLLSMQASASELLVGDFDSDGAMELAALKPGGNVYVFSGKTRELEALVPVSGTSLSAATGTTGLQMLVGGADGKVSVRAFDGIGYPELSSAQLASTRLDGVSVLGSGAWWAGAGGSLQRYAGGLKTLTTAGYGQGFGHRVVELAGKRWVFSAGGFGVHGFQVAP